VAPDAELIVTLGAQGLLWQRPGGDCRALPAFRVPVVDTNGAGDVLHGALALTLAEGLGAEVAVRRAMAAAALACRGTAPTRAELDHFLENAA
jgi:sulfofructose kinase